MIRLLAVPLAALLVLPQQSLAPYVPTPHDIVDRMLALAGVTRLDIVYDLGCGDGRIPIAAAKKYGARGVGIDIDPRRIEESKANAKAAGVEHLVEFRLEDVMTADVSQATVVTLYLLGSGNAKLRPLLKKQLRPGARIVSHAFSMGPGWPADRIDQFTTERGDEITLYLWRIGELPKLPMAIIAKIARIDSSRRRSPEDPFLVIMAILAILAIPRLPHTSPAPDPRSLR